MKDDYLWDRSGEPEAEIESLERTLGRLRHQPKPLELPRSRPQPRKLPPALAVAAALVLMILGAGLWLALHPSIETTQRLVTVGSSPVSLAGLYRKAESFDGAARERDMSGQSPDVRSEAERVSRQPRRVEERQAEIILARRAGRERHDERILSEGELATEKLMLALRYASSKLNLVQRQIQVNKERGPAS
jgi:hypothetical protein